MVINQIKYRQWIHWMLLNTDSNTSTTKNNQSDYISLSESKWTKCYISGECVPWSVSDVVCSCWVAMPSMLLMSMAARYVMCPVLTLTLLRRSYVCRSSGPGYKYNSHKCDLGALGRSQYPIKLLSSNLVSREICIWNGRFAMKFCGEHRQHCCRCARQISKRCYTLNYKSPGFKTSRDLTIRRLFGYWYKSLMVPLLPGEYHPSRHPTDW